MTALRIEAIEHRVGQGAFALSEETLGAHSYANLCDYFPGQRTFELTGCTDARRQGSFLAFNGSFEALFPWTKVDARVLLADSGSARQLILLLTVPAGASAAEYVRSYTPPPHHTIDAEFEELRASLEFEGAQVLFSTLTGAAPPEGRDAIRAAGFDPERIEPGLSFSVKGSSAEEDGYVAHLTQVFAISPQHPRRCHLSRSAQPSGYRLNCLFPASAASKPSAGPVAIEYAGVTLGLDLDSERTTDADFAVQGHLTLGRSLPQLEFRGEYLPQFGAVLLSVSHFPTLEQLLEALELTGDVALPKPLRALLQVQLSRLECVVNIPSELTHIQAPVLRRVGLALSMTEPLELIAGQISVAPTLELQLENPLDATQRELSGELHGSWQLGRVPLQTTLSYPALDFRASLPEGQTLGFADIERLFLPQGSVPAPKDPHQPEITKLEVSGNLEDGTLLARFALDAKSRWGFQLPGGTPFVVEGIELAAAREKSARTCSLRGRVALGGAEFELGAEYTSNRGWSFVGVQNSAVQLDLAWLHGQAQAVGVRASSDLVLRDVRFEAAPQQGFYVVEAGLGFRGAASGGALSIAFSREVKATSIRVAGQFGAIDEGSSVATGKPSGSIQELVARLGQVVELSPFDPPEALHGMNVGRFSVEVVFDEGADARYSFDIGGQLALGEDRALDVSLRVAKEAARTDVTGELSVAGLRFRLKADAEESSRLVAMYSHWGDRKLGLGELVSDVVALDGVEALNALQIDLKDVLFALSKANTKADSKALFGVDLAADLDLAKLPLAGQSLATLGKQGSKVGIDDLQVLYATEAFSSAELVAFNRMLGADITRLPLPAEASEAALAAGVSVGLKLNLGDFSRSLSVPLWPTRAAPSPAGAVVTPTQAEPEPLPTSSSERWLAIQKTLGPVHFARLGVEYRAQKLWLLLDASLRGAGFELSLEGLAIGAPISPFDASKVEFALRGVGIAYTSAAVEIGGMLLRVPGTASDDTPMYHGAATLKLKQLALSAFGSYTSVETPDGERSPSLFVYAVLDYPLGGPSFLFVTGLAAGFGYNRTLKMPALDRVASFPLVQAALEPARMLAPSAKDARVPEGLASLSRSVQAEPGQHFLAVGMRFTSFEIVTSFVLLSVEFGKHLEVHIVGHSTLVAPSKHKSGLPPVAEAELALVGSFLPEQGVLEVRAELSPTSHVLSRDCHITGGFAFATWFGAHAHAGDFVLTLGGYHPRYQIPEHYPRVPRLALNWDVATGSDARLEIKGDAYFALTASALMAGGHLDADFRQGGIHAWFKVGADFLIAWKPYHYEASAYVDVGAEVTFELFGTQHLELQLGADLELWGPEFSGEATIHYWIVSFTIEFGNAAPEAKALAWKEFRDSFLSEGVCGVKLADGLVREARKSGKPADSAQLGVVNAKELRLITNSRVPLKSATLVGPLPTGNHDFGIAPMGLRASQVQSTHAISVKRRSSGGDVSVSHEFEYKPVLQRVPRALWGQGLKPELHGLEYVEDVVTGYELWPKPGTRGQTVDVDTQAQPAESESRGFEPDMRPWHDESGESADEQQRNKKLKQLLADDTRRRALLGSLGFTPEDSSIAESLADALRATPRIGTVA